MRSIREVAFRLRQETTNLQMWMQPPRLSVSGPMAPKLPNPKPVVDKLRGSAYVGQVVSLAEEILAHRFRVLGLELDLGEKIDWRRDAVNQKETGLPYFRGIQYLDFERVGDHKVVWELNRQQHLVLLAQAFLFTGREEFLREVDRELESWWQQNPFLRGINWSSALEAAMRLLAWIWTDHLVGQDLRVRDQLLESLHQHGHYVEANLSFYFSPNTHLLGEAVALEALGVLYPWFPAARQWKQTGAWIMNEQLERQVRADGSHFEQSSYYHVYALDFFLFHRLLGDPTPDPTLKKMAEYLNSLMGPSRRLPLLGDDDGGRLFGLPSGRSHRGRATLATAAALLGEDFPFQKEDGAEQAAWWMGAEILDRREERGPNRLSRLYRDAGIAVMEAGGWQVLIDGGGFGAGSAGHSHSDTLSLLLSQGEEEILIDPGTYTYVADPHWRNWFRGSAAHNTVRLNGRDQALPGNPFRWIGAPQVELLAWETDLGQDYFDGACHHGGFIHRRRVVLLKQSMVMVVLDEIQGPPGEHLVEQFWHFATAPRQIAKGRYWLGRERRLWFSCAAGGQAELSEGGEHGWRSPAMGQRLPAPILRVYDRCHLPVWWAASFGLGSEGMEVPDVVLSTREDSICVRVGETVVRFFPRSVETRFQYL